MSGFIQQVLGEPALLVYLVVGAAVLAEDALFVGFVLPGETLAILGGVTASLGHTSLPVILLVVVLAAVVGDSIGYEVGRVWGTRLLDHSWLDRRRRQVDGARDLLRRRGGVAVFLGRWTAFLRAVTPALAGASRMPYRTFLPWNAVGGIAWGSACVIGGYAAGASYQRVETWLGRGAAIGVAFVVVVGLVIWRVRVRRRERAERASTAGRVD